MKQTEFAALILAASGMLVCCSGYAQSFAVNGSDRTRTGIGQDEMVGGESGRKEYLPSIHGTIRGKYEYEPTLGKGRFEVRNARINFDGKIVPSVSYKAEIDLSDEGKIKMLDAYLRFQPKDWKLTVGQMRVPFTIDAHRSPHLQYFANRSFIAKQVGNVRDVGAAVSWSSKRGIPITLEGGVFNGSGLTDQKDYWTDNYNFSVKVQTMIEEMVNVTLSCQKATAGPSNVMMWDAGAYLEAGRWHIEGEYLRKNYSKGAFTPVNAVDAFASYRIPMRRSLRALSLLGRYDYMSDHSKGGVNGDGHLKLDDPERHRLTGGLTFSLGNSKLQADIRLNYEQYFYKAGVNPAISEQNKLVLEFVGHF